MVDITQYNNWYDINDADIPPADVFSWEPQFKR